MVAHVGVNVGVSFNETPIQKRTALVFAGVSFALGVVVGWALRGVRIAYLKKKHEFLKRHAKKTEAALLNL